MGYLGEGYNWEEYKEFRSTRSAGVQECRSAGVQESQPVESPNLSNEINKSFQVDPSAVAPSQVSILELLNS